MSYLVNNSRMHWRKNAQLVLSTARVLLLACCGAVVLGLSGCSLFGPSQAPQTAPILTAPQAANLESSPPAPPPTAALDTLGLVAYAASMQGKPYRSAGDSPEEGFDCSGLVQHVFGRFELYLPRDAASMAAALPEVPFDELQAADLLFFNTQGGPYSHVGIYLGDGRFVHAPSPRTGRVIISPVSNSYWRTRVTAARRPEPTAFASLAAP